MNSRRSSLSRLGELLVTENLSKGEQLNEALAYQKANGGRLGSCLVRLNFLSQDDLTATLSRLYGITFHQFTYFEPDAEIIKILPWTGKAVPRGLAGYLILVIHILR